MSPSSPRPGPARGRMRDAGEGCGMQRGEEDAPRQRRPPPPHPGHLPTWGGAAPGAAHGERRRWLCGAPPAPQPHAEPRQRRLAAFPVPHAILTPPSLPPGSAPAPLGPAGIPPTPAPLSIPSARGSRHGPGRGGGGEPRAPPRPPRPSAPPSAASARTDRGVPAPHPGEAPKGGPGAPWSGERIRQILPALGPRSLL